MSRQALAIPERHVDIAIAIACDAAAARSLTLKPDALLFQNLSDDIWDQLNTGGEEVGPGTRLAVIIQLINKVDNKGALPLRNARRYDPLYLFFSG